MKNIFNTLSALLLLQVAAYAQQPANRTSVTKIADVLAQQPAEEQSKFLAAMKELEGFTADDIANLLSGMKGNSIENVPITYAANSYAFYVMQEGKESLRAQFSQGLVQALERLQDKEHKAFVLQLMKQASKDEAIAAIVPYLKDEYLVDKAALALNGVRTPQAVKALSSALNAVSSEKITIAIVSALGDLRSKADEDAIIATLKKYDDENFQRGVYTALSKIAGAKSAPVFLNKLKAVNYSFDKTNVGGLTLDYAHNLLREGNQRLALSVANTVMKGAATQGSATLQAGALGLLVEINPAKAKKQLLKAALSENALYRSTALSLLREKPSAADAKKLVTALKSASPDVQESIFLYLAKNGDNSNVSSLKDRVSTIKDTRAKIAALNAMSSLSDTQNAAQLIGEIKASDEATVQAISALLLSSKDPQTVPLITKALPSADVKTQLVLLDILSKRTDASASKAVLPLVSSTDAQVKEAALKALPTVAQPDDFDTLVQLLSAAPEADAAHLQKALVMVLNASDDKDAKIQRLAANISRSAAPSAANYFPVFAGVGGAEAMRAVQNYLPNDGLKAQAQQSLAAWSDPEVLPVLIELSRKEKGNNFATLFAGLVKQINASDHTAAQKTLYLKDAFAQAQNAAQKKQVLSSLQATETYQAMMFASLFLDDAELKGAATNTAMNIAMDNPDFTGTDVRNILEKAMANLSGSESSYLREAIVRHLAEMPKTQGFVSIFNGKDLTGWKGLVDDPIKRSKMSAKVLAERQTAADKKMRESWKAVNGDLVFSGHGDNIATVKQYGDFEMLVDWKLDPNGKEPDAGVYLRGTPQVQIWDISRTNVGAQVGSGGLYNNSKNPKDPLKVADNALGEWNTFKIRMQGEKVSVWLNGELVVDSVTLENYWDRSQPIFPMEQIELQAHGSQVWYRDIYVKELPRKEKYSLSDTEKKEGFEMLFDGTNLDKWTETSAYEINPEGFIRANPDAKFGKNLYTKAEYADFVYRFDFKLTPGANNGVGIRTPIEGDAAYVGTEIQILDNDADVYKNLKPYQYHGSAYGIIPAKRTAMKPIGEWNSQEIRVQGNKIKVTLNGVEILNGDLAEASKNGTLDGKNHPGLKNTKGHIGFLGHGSEVFLRNIRIQRL
ncbi:family 16 glycoside hydrolase [Sphingobacterium deserti]|uniref:3-keto-alpha-glucoside-1,2-lyase/3-keto-2-hydroxy-glucal hydratase domain-containing protein n=1 Tax=Sphingobacterium deserti TaxID=1229276 RepID=A0A0B8T6V2_9SPHI|nr:family 16 glycoside hydrolase [Sphingobacterium deserti]KGE13145.1 protein of unknown function DUF1080 [Sphingobacterium deserti]